MPHYQQHESSRQGWRMSWTSGNLKKLRGKAQERFSFLPLCAGLPTSMEDANAKGQNAAKNSYKLNDVGTDRMASACLCVPS